MINSGKEMADHILKRFDDELAKLTARIDKMAELVQQQVAGSLAALRDSDPALAQEIIDQDDKVDLYDIKIEKLCTRLLALQQPVALDLRTVLSALAVNRNLERIGDGAVNIAERITVLAAHPGLVRQSRIFEMGEVATGMVADSVAAFLHADINLARTVALRDAVIDEYDAQNFVILTGVMKQDSSLVEASSHLLMVSRNLERMADEATNIAEAAVFLAEAKIVKHGRWAMHFADENPDGSSDIAEMDGAGEQ